MGTERRRKVNLFDLGDDGTAAAAKINRWNGRVYTPRYYEILKKRKVLPIWRKKDEFLKEFRENQILILVGESGCGKSTQGMSVTVLPPRYLPVEDSNNEEIMYMLYCCVFG
uniref:probable pre-mRNA-splicing factor ATP-dependent RNA helicase DEAH2 n=1 Tax=Erigeron canadensis TaxID=72917 RepID=UPI001CB945B2|nr:probable pre-mRNA-splicing factor ATP-dependent RNA helicase DEAH2 [Erigeron canadensis]